MKCYLCGSTESVLVWNKIRYDLLPKPYQCMDCGFVYLYPQISDERQFYESAYRDSYDQCTAQQNWDSSLLEARDRANRFLDLYTAKSNVLEIGCATGMFLNIMKDRVASVTGIELTKEYVQFALARGIRVEKSIEVLPDNNYDAVFMFHVLEHLSDPITFLKDLKQKMKVNGKLIIEVPNVNDILVSVYKIPGHLNYYWEIAHNYYFSKETLGTVLNKSGFTFTIHPLQRYDLSNHMRWMQTGKPGGKGYYNDIFSKSYVREEYESGLKEQFLCDTIYAVATNG